MLPHQSIYLFQQYFYAGEFIMAGGAEEGRTCSERGSEALEENRQFSPEASPDSGASARPAADKNTAPDLQGKAPRSFNIRVVRQGTAAVFGFLADTRIELFGIPATFAPGKSAPGHCFSLKQERFKLLRLPN